MASRAVVMTRPRLCKIGEAITIDACLEETHSLGNTVTDHPVEDGANISDHCRPEPDMVTLRCFVSNTPLSQDQKTRAIKEGSFQFETTAVAPTAIGAVDGRGADTYAKLAKLRADGTLVKVATTLKTYAVSPTEGMVIQNITIPRTSKNYDGLEFTVAFKQIRIVRNRQTRDVAGKETQTKKKKKLGAQTTKETEQESTALYKLSDSAAGSDNSTFKGLGNFMLSGGK